MSDLLSQASLVMIPSGYKEDVVYSVVPSDGSGDLSFTRASNGTRVNSAGLVEVCPWNLVAQSESIGTSPWLLNGATLTSGQTDPSGGTTAVKVELASGGNNYVYQGIPFTNPINIVSAYLRADSATTIGFSVGGSTPNAVNLTTSWQLFTFSSTDTSGGIIFDNYFGPSPTQQAKTFYIWHPQLNIGTTAKPYFPTTDRLNVPRLTYQNGGGGCPSLLLEKQSTNICLWSEDFTQADWVKDNVTVTANNTTSPDGTQNADLIIPNTTSASDHRIRQNISGSGDFVFSVFVKAGGYNWVKLRTVFDWANVNLSTGAIGFTSGVTPTIQNMGNGWYRISILTNNPSGFAYVYPMNSNENSIDPSAWSGDGTSGVYLWGAQFEASSYSTSYIQTTSSSATRVADACFKTGISSLIGQTSGSVFFDFTVDSVTQPSDPVLWYMKDGGAGERYVELYSNGNLVYAEIDAGGPVAAITKSGLTVGRHKCAIAYATNDFVFYVDGVQIGTDTSGTPNGFSTFGLQYYLSTYTGSQKVNQCAIFKTRLTNAELASLTTI